ncbi:MAG: TraB/GumN family protein [Synechococcales bacterium]|nr:TraB/GumN family protein [Synechococcales bacterium]
MYRHLLRLSLISTLLLPPTLISLGLFTPSAIAQSKPKPSTIPTEKSLLWEISGRGLAKPSYLYGTIHAICPSQLKVPATLRSRFPQAQQLYLELDLDDPNVLIQSAERMHLPPGQTLQTLMKPGDYAKFRQFVQQRLRLSVDRLQTIKPLLLTGLFTAPLLGCQPTSWEEQLMQMAKGQRLEVLGLETVEEQMVAVDKVPLQQQIKMLMDVVNQFGKSQNQMRQLITLYNQQDIATLHRVVTDPKEVSFKFDAIFLRDRNRRWIPRIANIAQRRPTLFAVGAGHLGGSEGVIALLRKAGYTVKPVLR